ncbi:MAG: hypothetical protein EHM41_13285 [Chloroflexi bacterium]|nr:MAG: hypothetical protein EHM41_13285 [Chloroflexota bacterium]
MTSTSQSIYEAAIRINPFECDFKQELKPAAFFQHLTEAAGVHAGQLGVGFGAMYAQNLFWVLSRMKIKFFCFPQSGDLITVRTWPKSIQRNVLYIRDFEVLDSGGERLASATSAWLVMNATTRRMASPKSVNLNLPVVIDQIGLDESLDRLSPAQNGEERLRVRAGYSAVDIIGHVNNSRYVEWICDAFPLEMYRKHKIDWIQINYEHEILPGEDVSILVSPSEHDDGQWVVEGLNRSKNARAFESLLSWRD